MKFLKKIFSPFFLFFSFLLITYTYYQSEIYFDGDKREYYLIYYIISFILIFFSITSFFINDKIKEYLIISSLYIVASLYLFEGYSIFTNQLSKEQKYEKKTKNRWDKRTILEIYEDLKKEGKNITVKGIPANYMNKGYSIFPFSGISNTETIYGNENGYFFIYKSDRFGFNNPDKEWDKEITEYFLVGDSFTHGCCVNRPNDIASVIRKLSNKSVLNLGYNSNGPLIEYAILREYLKPNVKKVIWLYYEANDIDELTIELSDKILINYMNDLNFTQNLKQNQHKVNKLVKEILDEKIEEEVFKIKIPNFIKLTNTRTLIYPPSQNSRKEQQTLQPEFKRILKISQELVKKNNSELYFVYLPEFNRYRQNYSNKNYKLIKQAINELNIPFIDIHQKVFMKEKNPLELFPFEGVGHYNIAGYKKVAETIYKLTKN